MNFNHLTIPLPSYEFHIFYISRGRDIHSRKDNSMKRKLVSQHQCMIFSDSRFRECGAKRFQILLMSFISFHPSKHGMSCWDLVAQWRQFVLLFSRTCDSSIWWNGFHGVCEFLENFIFLHWMWKILHERFLHFTVILSSSASSACSQLYDFQC